ncbi:MAG: ABC transporter permease [Bacteriovoracaceae bacterium]|nr:ABC transporter permease [Bacteriovoracaceae bacterium]
MKKKYKKYFSSAITIFVAIIISFYLVRSMPGDFIHLRATEIQLQQSLTYETAYNIAKRQYNYDPSVPIYKQFIGYVGGLAHGNLGQSVILRIPVTDIIRKALPWTIFLCSVSLFISFLLGSIIGLFVSFRSRIRWLDSTVSFAAALSQSIPDFIIALLLIVILAINIQLFPLRGAYDVDTVPGFNIPFILGVLYHAVLPVMSYVISTIGAWTLTMKASASTVLSEDYINVAKAKGLRDKRILSKYIGKNAVIPLVPGLAISFAMMLSSSLFIENIFSYPGIGYFFGFSIGNRDFTLLQGILLISIVMIVISNHVADKVHEWLDPRIDL